MLDLRLDNDIFIQRSAANIKSEISSFIVELTSYLDLTKTLKSSDEECDIFINYA